MYDTKTAVKIAFLSHMTLQPTQNNVAPSSPVKCDSLNPLVLELDTYSLAHHLCKMWIFCEPRRL